MKALGLPLLADESIHPEVMARLRKQGKDVCSVLDEGLGGCDDSIILRHAHQRGRVVITHDRDFGELATRAGERFTGIIYLRPGHIDPSFVMHLLTAVEAVEAEVEPPFLVVAEWKSGTVRVRVRSGVQLDPSVPE